MTAATTTVRKTICALSLDNVSGGLRLSYWNGRQKMPNVQYFTNERIAQANFIVNPMTMPTLASQRRFLTVIRARN